MIKTNIYINGEYLNNRIIVLNSNNNIILNKNITNCISLCLKNNCYYKLIIYSLNNTLITSIIANKNYKNYYFSLNNINKKNFSLSDYNYKNLPIEKGEISLWQKQ